MQVPSIPPPIVTNAQPQDVAAKAVPTMQAMSPLVNNHVAESPKSENFNDTGKNKSRQRGDERKNRSDPEDTQKAEGDSRGNSLNIRV